MASTEPHGNLHSDPETQKLLQQFSQREQALKQQCSELQVEITRLETKLKHANRDMKHQSLHDKLTGLPNKQLMETRSKHAFQIARRQQFSCCLMLMDLNNFKDINDALGHQVGDLMLQEIASRFKKTLRSSDTLARLGGDEFALLLLNNTTSQAESVTKKIHAALARPFELEGHSLSVSISIGIAEFPNHADSLSGLMRHADVAMYQAKKQKSKAVLYEPMMDANSIERLALLNDLKLAIEVGELEIYYQPQIPVDGDGALGMEALVRWPHPQRGMVFPDQFIPLAEESGLIIPMTWWVMDQALAQCAAWHKAELPVHVSINFSALCFQDDELVQRVESCIKKYQLPEHTLVLEITESMIMEDPHQTSKLLPAIDNLNVDVSIDDFGTGHSSLAYLKYLLVDELKIDRSFVMGMHEFENDRVIVNTVINMAHNMGLHVVAEGVEDRRSWDMLVEMGCDSIQGYFISRPQSAANMTDWLKTFKIQGLRLDE